MASAPGRWSPSSAPDAIEDRPAGGAQRAMAQAFSKKRLGGMPTARVTMAEKALALA